MLEFRAVDLEPDSFLHTTAQCDRRHIFARLRNPAQLAHERCAPMRRGVFLDVLDRINHMSVAVVERPSERKTDLEELPMVFLPDFGLHRHSFVNGVGDLLGVPGIDDDTAVQRLSGSSELRDDHNALTF